MFSSRVIRTFPKVALQQQRKSSNIGTFLQNTVWKKSTVMYITYIIAGCVALEVVYGKLTNYIWDSYNYGVSIILFTDCIIPN